MIVSHPSNGAYRANWDEVFGSRAAQNVEPAVCVDCSAVLDGVELFSVVRGGAKITPLCLGCFDAETVAHSSTR